MSNETKTDVPNQNDPQPEITPSALREELLQKTAAAFGKDNTREWDSLLLQIRRESDLAAWLELHWEDTAAAVCRSLARSADMNCGLCLAEARQRLGMTGPFQAERRGFTTQPPALPGEVKNRTALGLGLLAAGGTTGLFAGGLRRIPKPLRLALTAGSGALSAAAFWCFHQDAQQKQELLTQLEALILTEKDRVLNAYEDFLARQWDAAFPAE